MNKDTEDSSTCNVISKIERVFLFVSACLILLLGGGGVGVGVNAIDVYSLSSSFDVAYMSMYNWSIKIYYHTQQNTTVFQTHGELLPLS